MNNERPEFTIRWDNKKNCYHFIIEESITEFTMISLIEEIKTNDKLGIINFNNRYNENGNMMNLLCKALRDNRTAFKVQLYFNELKAPVCKYIGQLLKYNKTIRYLNLDNCKIIESISHVCEGLKVNNTLTKLSIRHNIFDCEAAIHLAELLKVNRTLTELKISHNCINQIGMKHIFNALKFNDTLIVINIRDNHIGFEIFDTLKDLLKINDTIVRIKIRLYGVCDRYWKLLDELDQALLENSTGRKKQNFERGHILLLCHNFQRDSVFYKDNLPTDVFKIIWKLSGALKKPIPIDSPIIIKKKKLEN